MLRVVKAKLIYG